MAPYGAISSSMLMPQLIMVPVLDDHNPIRVMMVPAMIPMVAKLGAGVAIAMIDDERFSTCDRWDRETDGHDCCDDISKLLHDTLLLR
jgi:hypothetical protein